MTSPSSIFNFDLSWVRSFDLRAAAVAVAVLLAVELGVARSDWLWQRAPRTVVGAYFALEREVLAKAPPPTVVFVGSSRMRDAVAPRQLEQALGLPHGGVINLGLTGGTSIEAMHFYRRNRALLKQARVLVVGVEAWHWNDGVVRGDVARLFDTFDDRWRWYRKTGRPAELVGGVWRTLELQDALGRFAMSFLRGVTPVTVQDDRIAWRAPSEVREVGVAALDFTTAIDSAMEGYAPGPTFEDSLDRLVSMAHQDGVQVVLTILPVRGPYLDAVNARHPDLQPYVEQRLEAFHQKYGAQLLLFGRGTEVGIPDDRYYDYGHFTEDGCRRMVPLWVKGLKPLLP